MYSYSLLFYCLSGHVRPVHWQLASLQMTWKSFLLEKPGIVKWQYPYILELLPKALLIPIWTLHLCNT